MYVTKTFLPISEVVNKSYSDLMSVKFYEVRFLVRKKVTNLCMYFYVFSSERKAKPVVLISNCNKFE